MISNIPPNIQSFLHPLIIHNVHEINERFAAKLPPQPRCVYSLGFIVSPLNNRTPPILPELEPTNCHSKQTLGLHLGKNTPNTPPKPSRECGLDLGTEVGLNVPVSRRGQGVNDQDH